MLSLIAKFDGEKIELPEELRGAPPGEVLIVYPAGERTANTSAAKPHSIWEAFGKSPHPRSTEDINKQIAEERDSWGDR
jgi:hypothetical protein